MRVPAAPLAGPVDPEGSSHARGVALDPEDFVGEIDRDLLRALARLGEQLRAAVPADAPVSDLLRATLREQLETAEVSALWMTDEPDLELKLGLARKVGVEAEHHRVTSERLVQLGADPAADPRTRAHSALFRYLRGLQTPAERLAAGIASEGVSRLRNAVLAAVCDARGDAETARLCREVIGPDEVRHLEFGRRLLPRYALTVDDQERARRAVARCIQLAEEAADPTRPAKTAAPAPAENSTTGR